ncbi:hypothetical protein MPSEU_000967000 [Mayamaea pseudoterrestris]|nr:hypothetical protein MPSEU_000967000 [Mayamaea pseudoterrestris]
MAANACGDQTQQPLAARPINMKRPRLRETRQSTCFAVMQQLLERRMKLIWNDSSSLLIHVLRRFAQLGKRQQQQPRLLLLLILLFTSSASNVVVSAQSINYFTKCFGVLQRADANIDLSLDRTEYAAAVLELSHQKIDIFNDFANVPPSVTEFYTANEDSTSGGILIAGANDAAVAAADPNYDATFALCDSLYDSIYNVWSVGVDAPSCVASTTTADASGNNVLDEEEYVALVNDLTNDAASGFAFAELPESVQTVFVDFAGIATAVSFANENDVWQRNFCSMTNLEVTVAASNVATEAPVATEPPLLTMLPTAVETATSTSSASVTSTTSLAPTSAESIGFTVAPTASTIPLKAPSLFATTLAPESQAPSITPTITDTTSGTGSPAIPVTTSSESPSVLPSSTPSLLPTITVTSAPSSPPSVAPIPVSELSASTQVCLNAIGISDFNKDDNLATDEYTAFCNILGQQTFPLAFRFLDESLIGIFEARRVFSAMPVTGANVAEASNQVLAQDFVYLDDLCTDVWTAVLKVSNGTIAIPTEVSGAGAVLPPTAAPTAPPVAFADLTSGTQTCVTAMKQADANLDEQIATDEYTALVNILTDNTSPQAFRYLDPALIAVFESHREVTVIPAAGIFLDPMPATNATALEQLCTEILNALPIVIPTEAPIAVSDLTPATQVCVDAMKQVDANRDESLATDEYTNFVNVLGQDSFSKAFRYLDESLQSIFDSRRDVSVIHVTGIGSNPIPAPNATSLEGLCTDVWKAVSRLTAGVIQPPMEAETNNTSSDPLVFVADLTPSTISCIGALKVADVNQDESLVTDEYTNFVNILGNNTFSKVFRYLDPSLISTFESYRDVTVIHAWGIASDPMPASNASALEDFCGAVWSAVAVASNGTIAPPSGASAGNLTCPEPAPLSESETSACKIALIIGDANRDDMLDQFEWIRFLNRLTRNKYSSVTTFAGLPEVVQTPFQELSDGTGMVSVSGSKPGATPTEEELVQIQDICSQVYGVMSCMQYTLSNDPGDNDSSTLNTTDINATELNSCKIAMVVSDISRDEQLDDMEYVRFLNRLTDNRYINKAFSELAQPLQTNYEDLTDASGFISITGSRPGATPTIVQSDNLKSICVSTLAAVASAEQPESGYSTNVPSNDARSACNSALVVANVNRDSILVQSEYVRFIAKILNAQAITFDELDSVFQNAFYDLSQNGAIDITGAEPGQDATKDQQRNVARLCEQVDLAIQAYNNSLSPTGDEEELPVYNSFLLSIDSGLNASALADGRRRRELDEAYAEFIEDLINTIMQSRLRGRRLQVSDLKAGSPEIYQIDDSVCPAIVAPGATCQTAYASFVLFLRSNTENKASITQSYQALSQIAIDQGKLDAKLKEINPTSEVTVVSSILPIKPPESSEAAESTNDSYPSMGAIIGIAAAVAVVIAALCIGIYVCYDFRKNRVAAVIEKPEKDKDHSAHKGAYLDDSADILFATGDLDHFGNLLNDGDGTSQPSKEYDLLLASTSEGHYNQRYQESAVPQDSDTVMSPLTQPDIGIPIPSNGALGVMTRSDDKLLIFNDAYDAQGASVLSPNSATTDLATEGVTPETLEEEIAARISMIDAIKAAEEANEEIVDEEEFTEEEILDDDDGSLTSTEEMLDEEQEVITYDVEAMQAAAAAAEAALLSKDPDAINEIAALSEENEVGWSSVDDGSSAESSDNDALADMPLAKEKTAEEALIGDVRPERMVQPTVVTAESLPVLTEDPTNNQTGKIDTTKEAQSSGGESSDEEEDESTDEKEDDEESDEDESSDDEKATQVKAEEENSEDESEEEEDESGDEESADEESSEEESEESEEDDESDNEAETSEELVIPDEATRAAYRSQVAALVGEVVPSELDNVDAMMEQFLGREAELIMTLQNMAAARDSSDEEEESDEDEESDEEEESGDEEGSEDGDDSSDEDESNDEAKPSPTPIKKKDASDSSEDESSEDSDSS